MRSTEPEWCPSKTLPKMAIKELEQAFSLAEDMRCKCD